MTKKISVLFALVILTAGYTQAQFKLGVKGGFYGASVTMKYEGEKIDEDYRPYYKPGFLIGLVGEYAFNNFFAIQPGIIFATQGYKQENSYPQLGYYIKETKSLNYIQIPINAQCKIGKLILQAGPYLGYGIGGKSKRESTLDGDTRTTEHKIKFGDGDDDDISYMPKAFDFGIGLGAGLQFNKMQLGLSYNIGLANLTDVEDSSMTNKGMALTLVYLFK